jgi:two-component system LytT family response regulator
MAEPGHKLRAIVADDEPLARSTLRRLLGADADIALVAECADGAAAVAAVRQHSPDLLFLDVQMPGLGGFDVLAQLGPQVPPLVIFVTAYDRYAIRAFDVHAVDYLLKPFDDERFHEALAQAKRRHKLERLVGMTRQLSALLDDVRGGASSSGLAAPLQRLTIHREGQIEVVEVGDIEWIEAADQYVIVHTEQAEHLLREPLADLEQQLDPARFVRIHRSAIVALARVRKFEREASGVGRVLLAKNKWLPVSRSRVAALRERLG